jgi:hypothetical protein
MKNLRRDGNLFADIKAVLFHRTALRAEFILLNLQRKLSFIVPGYPAARYQIE